MHSQQLFLLAFAALFAGAIADATTNDLDPNCDPYFNRIIDSCHDLRNQMISAGIRVDHTDVCCKKARYDLCVKKAGPLKSVSKQFHSCSDAFYEPKLAELKSESGWADIVTFCKDFSTTSCVTEPLKEMYANAKKNMEEKVTWENFKESFNNGYQNTMDALKRAKDGVKNKLDL